MVVGFCGSGSMAAAMARGWAGSVDSMLFTDSGSGRAERLAAEVGGEKVGSNSELAERADVLVLAVKPAMLEGVAPELGQAKAVISVLGATGLERLRGAFPGAAVTRVMPNLAVEVRQGVLCTSGVESTEIRNLLRQLGMVAPLPDGQIDAATAVMGCSPAYIALVAEALSSSGVEAGLSPDVSLKLVTQTIDGTAALLRHRSPEDVRQAVTSPGGSTEAGLEALDREGAREAFAAAVEASLARMRG